MDLSTREYKKINRIPRRFIFVMALAALSINILSLALPLTMKKIYGAIILTKSIESLRFVLLVAFIALALEALMRKVKDSSSKWIASKYEYQLTEFLVRKILKSYNQNDSSHNYISNIEKFKSLSKICTFYSTAYYQLFIDVPFMFIFLYLIYLYGGMLVFIPIGLTLIFIMIVLIISELYFKNQSRYIYETDRLMGQLTETLEKIHFIKSAGIEESQINKYKKLLENVAQAEYRSNRYNIIPKNLASSFSQLTLFMILIGGGYMVTLGEISFGQITACAMLGGRAIAPIVSLMRYYQQTKDIKILQSRIDLIASQKEQYSIDTPDFPEDIIGTIELINLTYKDVHSAKVNVISKLMNAGDFITINPVTFQSYHRIINQIVGFEPVTSGKILIDNLDINEWNMHSLKGKVESLNERVSIFRGSVLDNITFFDQTQTQNAFDAAALTGLEDIVGNLPEGFATQIDGHVVNYFSAAFMQRLNLARALLIRPRIMILDRIDESMDEETLFMYRWLLEKLKGQLTIILISSKPELIELGDYPLETR